MRQCERRWLNITARSDRCHQQRRPALGQAHAGLCEVCAGIVSTQVCGRCGAEEDLYASARCAACYLADEIDGLRATGDPDAVRTLDRYLTALQAARPANSVLHWLRISRTSAAPILRDLLTGVLPVTHDALDHAPGGHATEFLRAALVKHGALPERDEICHRFERWIIATTDQLPDHPDRANLRRWATWIILRDLRDRRRASPTSCDRAARARVRVARDFIARLHQHGLTLATTGQHDIDRWLAEGATTRHLIRPFLRWTSKTKLTPPLDASAHRHHRQGIELADDQRRRLITQLLHDNDLGLRTRVAGLLILLYGQPLAGVTRLRVEHIHHHNDQTSITLGQDPPDTAPADRPARPRTGPRAARQHPARPHRTRLALPRPTRRRPDHTRTAATTPRPATRTAPHPTRPPQRHHSPPPNNTRARPRRSPRLQPKPRRPLGPRRRSRLHQLRRRPPQRSSTLKHLSPIYGTGRSALTPDKYDLLKHHTLPGSLIGVERGGRVRAWSRHGTSLAPCVGSLLECFAAAPLDTVFDGELVALGESDGRPVQDFATVTCAVFTGSAAAAERLRFVGFDVLRLGGQDLRARRWRERDERLRDALPIGDRVTAISSQPASSDAHDAIVQLGFEGTVLKRPSSAYRAGRHAAWVKHKARHVSVGVLLEVRQGRDGEWHGVCEVEGRRVTVLAGSRMATLTGQSVELAYSRVDADGGLREARITTAAAA